jgi:hypothetical protein
MWGWLAGNGRFCVRRGALGGVMNSGGWLQPRKRLADLTWMATDSTTSSNHLSP